ncbi:histidine phosphatase family protein [Rossellomorea aquimaris]|uniref:histidine phosphatase family protein n=1 Tax=Rossellomorea aquimaris TaxID=189382 RepID=UPI0007D0420D|nr:histidine phosphatase family protein [Rossellomorea aquimaris]
MKTHLYFVRHAHSTYTPDELNRPLSENGRIDADHVTNFLIKEDIQIVCSSPYKRAIETVNGISEYIDKEIVIFEDLKERTLSKQPVENFNESITNVWNNPSFSYEGGESNLDAQERGISATHSLLEKYRGKKVVIGSHGNIMVLIMNYFDRKYDFQFWKELSMPDIYRLTFEENNLVDVKRIWNRTN